MTSLCAFHGIAGSLFAARAGPVSVVDHAQTTANHDVLAMILLAAAAIVLASFVFAARHLRAEPCTVEDDRPIARS